MQSTKSEQTKVIDFELETVSTASLSNREKLELEYLRGRDPMREFFALVSTLVSLSLSLMITV